MDTNSTEELVQALTREVMQRLASPDAKATPSTSARPTSETPNRKLVLVLGDPRGVVLGGGRDIETEDCYAKHGNIDRYDAVHITSLSNAQLCDIALGRDTIPFTCAVVNALLRNIPVTMLESAPVWRRLAVGAPTALSKTLCGYEEKLAAYGVKFLADAKKPLSAGSARTDGSKAGRRIITADVAKQLCNGVDEVVLSSSDIVTPLAKDVFTAAKTKICRGDH